MWYLLLRVISSAGADSVRGFQIGMVVVSIATCLAAYLLGRAVAGPLSGFAASGLLTIAPPYPLFAHRVIADIPPLGLALLSLWLAWRARERRSVAAAAGAGAMLVLAVFAKPNAALAAPIVLVLLLWDRSGRRRALLGALGGAAAVAAAFLLAYRDVLRELWASVVVYHRNARDTPAVIDKTHELITFLNWRTPFAWLVLAGLAASLLLLRRRKTRAVWILWLWVGITIVFLIFHHPLHYNHLLALPVVLAVPAGAALAEVARQTRYPVAAVLVFVLVLTAGYVQQQRRVVLDIRPEERNLVAAAALLARETSPDDLVVSDQSIVPFLAGRRVAGPLVDTARLRFQTGSLTDDKVLSALERYDVRAVVAGRAFAERPALMRALARRYGRPRSSDGELFVFLERSAP